MKKWLLILVLIIAISIVLGCVEKQPVVVPTPSPTTPKTTPAENLIPLHLNAASVPRETCKTCHDVHNETSLKPDIKVPHVGHLNSGLLKFECNTCHKSIDLKEISSASLRRQVDPAFCTKCHSPFPIVMDAANKDKDCTTCHSDWKTGMAGATFINLDVIASKDCFGCHGGRAWYMEGIQNDQ